jgi:hypothetical protein
MDSSYLKEFLKSTSMSKSASGEINRDALREIHPSITLGCFIRKPVEIDYLIDRIIAELD